jgi:hypothetical protein
MNCNFLINTAALVLLFFATNNVASLEYETTVVEDMLETTASDLGDYLSITSTVSIMHDASSAVLITDAVALVNVYNTSGNITTSSAASLLIVYVNLLVFVFSDIICIMKTRNVG